MVVGYHHFRKPPYGLMVRRCVFFPLPEFATQPHTEVGSGYQEVPSFELITVATSGALAHANAERDGYQQIDRTIPLGGWKL